MFKQVVELNKMVLRTERTTKNHKSRSTQIEMVVEMKAKCPLSQWKGTIYQALRHLTIEKVLRDRTLLRMRGIKNHTKIFKVKIKVKPNLIENSLTKYFQKTQSLQVNRTHRSKRVPNKVPVLLPVKRVTSDT